VTIEDFPDVLRRATGGDESAFGELFRSTQPLVLRYLSGLAPAPVVDDIASDAWVSVVRGLDSFVGDELGSFHAWVLTMARRRWVDEVRRHSRRPEYVTDGEALSAVAASSDVDTELDQRLGEANALQLLKRLPSDQAEVVLLRAVAGLDVERVAQIVGKTPGSVRVLSHRGLRRLATLLEPPVTNREASSMGEVR
jgi:RNA polymerase sigma-70 factor (ECF subfamily)